MALASMTGFARGLVASPPYRLVWEIKTVNSRGLDLRLRLPPGFDAIEPAARKALGARLQRGSCSASLNAQREASAPQVRINTGILADLARQARAAAAAEGLAPPGIDSLIAVRGVVDVVESGDDEATMANVFAAALATLDEAAGELVAMREAEGAALGRALIERLDAIAALTKAADEAPGRRPEAARARLEEGVARILDVSRGLDPARLHQEAALLAAKAEIREELDRLVAHVAAARALLAAGGPVGRRLDFLAQEFGREANTLCAKSNDSGLTAIGLDLRAEIEQFREQVQNIE